MASALKAAGKTYQYETKAREGHGFVGKKSQVEFYTALESFLEANLKAPGDANAK
jgi:dipeptidyl aminopeptidase/acylaminoacyl peptidase